VATRYVDHNLHGDEKVCYRGHVSWAVLLRGLILLSGGFVLAQVAERHSVLSFIAGVLMLWGLLALVRGILFKMFSEYAVTDRRVIGKYGIIRPESVDVLLTSVSGVSTSFTVIGRIFGYGSVLINGNGTQSLLAGMSRPKAFEDAVHERLEGSRLLKGTAAYTLNVQPVPPEGPPQPTTQTMPAPAASAVASSFCGQCGATIAEGTQFCRGCGAPA
jgi:uncharacterized membrane protein YdbT with pleckstrin-like domain